MKTPFTLSLEDIEAANGAAVLEGGEAGTEVEPEMLVDIAEGDLEEHSDNIDAAHADVIELIQATETGEDATNNLAEIAASVEALGIYGEANVTSTAAFLVAGVNREFARLAGPGVRAARFIPGLESLEDHLEKIEDLIESTADGVVSADTSVPAAAEVPEVKAPEEGSGAEEPVAAAHVTDVSGEEPHPAADVTGAPTDAEQAAVVDGANTVAESTELVVDPAPAADEIKDVEASGGDVDREAITGDELKPAVEGIMASVGKIANKLVDNLRKVGKAIMDHFAAVFSGFNGLKRRAFAIKQKAKTVKGEAAHAKIVVNGLHRLAMEGKVDQKSIMKGLHTTAAVADFAFNGYTKTVGDFYSAYATHLSKAEADWRKNHDWAALNEGIQAMTKTFKEDAAKAFGAHSNGDVLSGDRVFEMTTGHFPTLNKKKGAASTLSKQETETLSPKDVIAVCDIVSNMATKFVRYDELYLKVLHAREKALNDAYVLIEDGKSDISHGSASWSVLGFAPGFVYPVMDLGDYTFTVMRSALAYADRSLKEYSAA
jgi:hypothetical protein